MFIGTSYQLHAVHPILSLKCIVGTPFERIHEGKEQQSHDSNWTDRLGRSR